ncbi:CpaF family protein [Caldalkalibacillus salinus]|uniref:CpaF family protein n=1 Tax=Caldalkalibacillus salinus TaxID=2803787 RepID=UPI001923584D|nr:CpaF family protein [Caldalkalibacillus salinus]
MNEYEWLELKREVQNKIDLSTSVSDSDLQQEIEETVFHYAKQQYIGVKEKKALVERIFHSLRGLDILQPLMDDPHITEIMINSPREIFIEREGKVYQEKVLFENQQKLEDIIQLIVGKVNRIVNESTPIVDARLEDGSRVHVVLPPIAIKGPTLTIRKFPQKPITMDQLIQWGSISKEAALFLQSLVQAKFNIFIGGGTGSGKTTFLNVLSSFIPAEERVITIEDSAELQIQNIPNLVNLETRNPNTEGKGGISIKDLIRASLRMRPNRIVVGEVRGSEALDMLQAMNTGHDGSLSTGHANSTHDMLSRLETMVLMGASLPVEVIRKQISSAIDIMIHLSRLRDMTRRVTEISEVLGVEDGEIKLNPLYVFEEQEERDSFGAIESSQNVHHSKLAQAESRPGKVVGELKPTGRVLQKDFKLKLAGVQNPLISM